MQDTLFYAKDVTKNTQHYINLYRDRSRMDSKNHEVTTRDGHVRGILCNFKITTVSSTDPLQAVPNVQLFASGAPNSWKMRNAFRKFHAYRNIMFERSGVTEDEKGRYGKTIRPLLDDLMEADDTNVLDPLTFKGAQGPTGAPTAHIYEGGEWTYTSLATTPIYEEGSLVQTTDSWADAFNLHICDENVVVGATSVFSGTYKSVGMIHSYNIDRMEVVTPDADTTITGPSNPLAALISSGNQATGEVIDIAENLELELPPYDLDDNGDSIFMNVEGYGVTKSTGGTISFNAFVPAGLCRYFLPEENTAALEVTVLGKVLCKDMS